MKTKTYTVKIEVSEEYIGDHEIDGIMENVAIMIDDDLFAGWLPKHHHVSVTDENGTVVADQVFDKEG